MKTSPRQILGLGLAQISAIAVYSKPMEFDHPNVVAKSHIAVAADGSYAHFNTYDGGVGRNFDYKWLPKKDGWDWANPTGDLRKKLKGYELATHKNWPAQIKK